MNTFKTPKGTELPLLDLRGKPYLQVPHRLVWFREDHVDWVILVEFIERTDKHVMAKASIYDETGKLRAAAHKVEHYAHFADALEKAETSSIGRALAMIGYGTQFAPDIDEQDRIVDSPVKPQKPNQSLYKPPPQQRPGQQQAARIPVPTPPPMNLPPLPMSDPKAEPPPNMPMNPPQFPKNAQPKNYAPGSAPR